jgi:hypothetical protein
MSDQYELPLVEATEAGLLRHCTRLRECLNELVEQRSAAAGRWTTSTRAAARMSVLEHVRRLIARGRAGSLTTTGAERLDAA